MKVYYRLSNQSAGGHKNKLPHATKHHCLKNTITLFGKENVTVIGDTLNLETTKMVNDLDVKLVKVSNGSGARTFRDAYNLAISENEDDELIYLLEDDFLHKHESKQALETLLTTFDCYATTYDHPDKYLDPNNGGNPFCQGGAEDTRVYHIDDFHWKITNSTVMSFAARCSRLKNDKEIIYKHSNTHITDSFRMFLELRDHSAICLSSIPGYSTHTETAWLSPLTDWSKL